MSDEYNRTKSRNGAWALAYQLTGSREFSKDDHGSKVAGYPIYRDDNDSRNYICDLSDRFEINLANGKSVNAWIQKPKNLAEYAEFESETLTIRTYVNGNSADTLRFATDEERNIIKACISGALSANVYSRINKQNVMDVAEYIADNAIENLNGYDSVYNKIRSCPNELIAHALRGFDEKPNGEQEYEER